MLTFIFFALEGSITAQGLQLGMGIPLWLGYAVSTLMEIPLVIGMKALAKLQVWTTPLWLILFVIPMAYLLSATRTRWRRSSPTRARTAAERPASRR